MLKAVLFDHDGTLVDSEGLHCKHWQSVMAGHGVILSETTYKDELAGVPTPDNANWLIREFGLKLDTQSLIREKQHTTQKFLSNHAFPLMPDAKQVLCYFRAAGLRIGMVTGAGRLGPLSTFDTYDLYTSIDVLITGEDVQCSKPAPDGYLLALERLGLKPEECLAVEDSGPGVAAAAAAGIDCCVVPNQYSAHHDFSPAVRILKSLSEITGWANDEYDLRGYVY